MTHLTCRQAFEAAELDLTIDFEKVPANVAIIIIGRD